MAADRNGHRRIWRRDDCSRRDGGTADWAWDYTEICRNHAHGRSDFAVRRFYDAWCSRRQCSAAV